VNKERLGEIMYLLKRPETQKDRKRVGRGTSSGHGKTSCRGTKGQLARAGSKKRAWFEGGQMPLQRRIPKRGFNNIHKTYYQVVNIKEFAKINSSEINPDILEEHGIIRNSGDLIKILGSGELEKPVKVVADAFSNTAREIITKAGGEVIIRDKINKNKQDKN
jgi:large subunit ribosomal protein L15